MINGVATVGMSREEWLKLRKTGIGGSDAGAICGLNPYSSPMSVYQDKISDKIELSDSEAMRQGRELEEYVARRFMEASGKKVRRSNLVYRNPEYPFMIANVDRIVVGEDAGLECKTASAYNADKWKDGEIPPHYLIQCLHYMAVTGKREWYIAVVILGQEFKFQRIMWQEELIRNLIQIEENFWNNHIVPGIMPDPDGSEACDEILKQYCGRSRKGSCIQLSGFDEILDRRAEISMQIDSLTQEKSRIEQEVKLFMKDYETAVSEKYRVLWTNVDTERLDVKRIKAEKPEIYKGFLSVTSSRRFTVKAA